MRALAAQDIQEEVEYLLFEDVSVPLDVLALLPGVRVVRLGHGNSYARKNAGAREAAGEFVAILDSDCEPGPEWLRVAVEAMRARPEMVGVSGRTMYPGGGVMERVRGLLSRAFLDRGVAGETEFISNNAGVIRRSAFLRHPFPEDLGIFSARIQSEAMRREGGVCWFDPRIRVVHEFAGWEVERDQRENAGWGTVATRLADGAMPWAGLVRVGFVVIPLIWAGKLWELWGAAWRCWRFYGIRWWELPLVMGLAVVLISMEAPGMWKAYWGVELGGTGYR